MNVIDRVVTAYCARRLHHDQVADTFLVVWRRLGVSRRGRGTVAAVSAPIEWSAWLAQRATASSSHRSDCSRPPVGAADSAEAVVEGDEVRRVLAAHIALDLHPVIWATVGRANQRRARHVTRDHDQELLSDRPQTTLRN